MRRNNLAKVRIGEINTNKQGSLMEIVEYNNCDDIIVKFIETDNLVHTRWRYFLNQEVINPFDKSILGLGYLGEGKYKAYENYKTTNQYASWIQMLRRCYSEEFLKSYPTYLRCNTVEEWHNFQTFAKWYDENYYTIDDEVMCLDKDILIKGNKLYSPETCVFVPNRINTLFIKRDLDRGDLPLGVTLTKNNKYQASCSIGNRKIKYIGVYSTPKEAFYAYKKFKEKYIKEVVEDYKDKIPSNLYEAMYKYQVDIND